MLDSTAGALTPDRELLRTQIAGRTLNTSGVALLSCALALFTATQFHALERTLIGLASAATMLLVGELFTRRGSQAWSFGTSLVAAGYLLAAFITQATFYVPGLETFASPCACWVAQLLLGAIATVHLSRNSVLRYFALPFTLLLTGNVLAHTLSSTELVDVAGWSFKLSSLASVFGMLWFAGLSALYTRLQDHAEKNATGDGACVLYRVGNELYFVLAALNALALPQFLSSPEYAPLWWALETPVLLAICWRSKSFVKHALVMGIWGVAAVMLLINKMELSPFVRMALPVSGLVMALSYRYLQSSWAKWQKLTGYAVYLYGSAAVALLVPFLQLGAVDGLTYFLAESALLVGLALAMRDRLLHKVGIVVGALSLAVFASQFQHWSIPLVASVVTVSYGISLWYGHYTGKDGLAQSEFALVPGPTMSAGEARYLEYGTGIAGYLSLLSGSYLLFSNPVNTMLWGVEAFSLIAFGFLSKKVGHRFSGLIAMGIASAKLTIFDLSGAGTLTRTLISFGAVGVCCVAASIFYLREYGNQQKKQGS